VTPVCVGNDIVDLERPRTVGRAADDRFVARILDDDEREVVLGADDADRERWCHWAAKEAGFKALSKLVGEAPPFVHRAFKVTWTGDGEGSPPLAGPAIRRGTVSWKGARAPVSIELRAGGVHAVAYATAAETPGVADGGPMRLSPRVEMLAASESPWAGSLEHLLSRFTEREADAIHSLWSAAVRIGARGDLAERMGVTEERLEIVCGPGRTGRRLPRVLMDGEEVEADVSLSHDGRLIAWATWVGRNLRTT